MTDLGSFPYFYPVWISGWIVKTYDVFNILLTSDQKNAIFVTVIIFEGVVALSLGASLNNRTNKDRETRNILKQIAN